MATFDKNKLALTGQGIAGRPRDWSYWDTGVLVADINEVDGFITNGYDIGMRKGDRFNLTEGDTGLWAGESENPLIGGRRQYIGTVMYAQDTGATQVKIGRMVLVGDTG
jgi:hypothetical protein